MNKKGVFNSSSFSTITQKENFTGANSCDLLEFDHLIERLQEFENDLSVPYLEKRSQIANQKQSQFNEIDLEDELHNVLNDIEQKEKDCKQIVQICMFFAHQSQSLGSQLNELQIQLADQQRTSINYQSQLDSCYSELKDKNEKIEMLENELSSQQNSIRDLQEGQKSKLEEMQVIMAENKILKRKEKQLGHQLEQVIKSKEKLEEIDRYSSNNNDEKENQANSINQELDNLETQVNIKQKQLDQQLQKVKRLEKELMDKESSLSKYRYDLKQLQFENQKLEENLAIQIRLVQDLQSLEQMKPQQEVLSSYFLTQRSLNEERNINGTPLSSKSSPAMSPLKNQLNEFMEQNPSPNSSPSFKPTGFTFKLQQVERLTPVSEEELSNNFNLHVNSIEHKYKTEVPTFSTDNTQVTNFATESLQVNKPKSPQQRREDADKEFFKMILLSYKMRYPEMSKLLQINSEKLYQKAKKEGVAFYEFTNWIDQIMRRKTMGALYGGSFIQNIQETDAAEEDEVTQVKRTKFRQFINRQSFRKLKSDAYKSLTRDKNCMIF